MVGMAEALRGPPAVLGLAEAQGVGEGLVERMVEVVGETVGLAEAHSVAVAQALLECDMEVVEQREEDTLGVPVGVTTCVEGAGEGLTVPQWLAEGDSVADTVSVKGAVVANGEGEGEREVEVVPEAQAEGVREVEGEGEVEGVVEGLVEAHSVAVAQALLECDMEVVEQREGDTLGVLVGVAYCVEGAGEALPVPQLVVE